MANDWLHYLKDTSAVHITLVLGSILEYIGMYLRHHLNSKWLREHTVDITLYKYAE